MTFRRGVPRHWRTAWERALGFQDRSRRAQAGVCRRGERRGSRRPRGRGCVVGDDGVRRGLGRDCREEVDLPRRGWCSRGTFVGYHATLRCDGRLRKRGGRWPVALHGQLGGIGHHRGARRLVGRRTRDARCRRFNRRRNCCSGWRWRCVRYPGRGRGRRRRRRQACLLPEGRLALLDLIRDGRRPRRLRRISQYSGRQGCGRRDQAKPDHGPDAPLHTTRPFSDILADAYDSRSALRHPPTVGRCPLHARQLDVRCPYLFPPATPKPTPSRMLHHAVADR